jgi:hypothetical protein
MDSESAASQLDNLFVLTTAQQRLVDLVGQIYGRYTRWPNFNYVKRELRRTANLDATDVVDTLPSVPLVHSQRYGALWASTMRPIPRESELRLSVLGASMCTLTTGNVSSWLGFVSTLSEMARHQQVDPFEVQPRDIATSVVWSMRQIPPPPIEKAVLDLLVREPLTGEANPRETAEGWVVTMGLIRFDGQVACVDHAA